MFKHRWMLFIALLLLSSLTLGLVACQPSVEEEVQEEEAEEAAAEESKGLIVVITPPHENPFFGAMSDIAFQQGIHNRNHKHDHC